MGSTIETKKKQLIKSIDLQQFNSQNDSKNVKHQRNNAQDNDISSRKNSRTKTMKENKVPAFGVINNQVVQKNSYIEMRLRNQLK